MESNLYQGWTHSSALPETAHISRPATWNAWVEAAKSDNMEIQIRKWANTNNVAIKSLYSKDCYRDFFDKILGIRRETVFFHLEGDLEKLDGLKRIFLNWSNSIQWTEKA